MEENVDLKKLVDAYQWQCRDVDKALQALANDVNELDSEVRNHQQASDDAQANLDALEAQQAALQDERASLFRQHSEASFVQDTAKLQSISRRRASLDEELEEVRDDIRNCVTPHKDFGKHAANLKLRHDDLKQRLPSISMLPIHVEVLPPFLKSIYEAVQADRARLHDKHKAIEVPALFTSKQLESLRMSNSHATKANPAFLLEQERKRIEQEKQRKRKNINHNERMRRGGGPAHTGSRVREASGVSNLAGMVLAEVEKA